MKIPERLVVPLVHRHRRYYPHWGELHELDAEVLSDTLTTLENGLYVHGPCLPDLSNSRPYTSRSGKEGLGALSVSVSRLYHRGLYVSFAGKR